MTAAGRFITLEGGEGAGKSTCIAAAKQLLESVGKQVELTREPGGTPLGEELRELLLAHRHQGMAADSELLLMFAARAEHLEKRIRPCLNAGHWVLCDRFTDATLAYQGGGRGIAAARIEALAEWVHADLWPDLTLLLDVPVAVGLERAGRRSGPDRIESETVEFFERVRAAYLQLAARHPQRFRIIDAARPLEAVLEQVRAVLTEFVVHVD